MKDPVVQIAALPLKQTQTPTQSPIIKRTCSYHEQIPWYQFKCSSTNMAGRYHHSSVLVDGKLFVYGGFDYQHGVLADFHVLDSVQCDTNRQCESSGWRQIYIYGSPGPRHSHTSVHYKGNIYVFGGKIDRFKSTNSIHAYNIRQDQWTIIQEHQQNTQNIKKQCKQHNKANNLTQKSATDHIEERPGPIDSHQAVVVGKEMIIYGGFSNNEFRDQIYGFNLQNYTWRKIYPQQIQKSAQHSQKQQKQKTRKQPQARSDFSMVAYNNKLLIYAGKNLHTSFSDLWYFDLKTCQFTQIVPKFTEQQNDNASQILKRNGHSAIIYEKYMVVFGGMTSVTHQRNDLLCYHIQNKTWKVLWKNCQEAQEFNRKAETRKTQNTRVKILQNTQSKDKNQQSVNEKPKKYRRPIAQQKKKQHVPHELKSQKERYKKQNQRKFQILQQLQNAPTSFNKNNSMSFLNGGSSTAHNLSNILRSNFRQNDLHFAQQQHSPLLQSLTNSIMLTSHACPGSCSSRQAKQGSTVPVNYGVDICEQGRKKLKARDGHTAHLSGHQMIIFGGDRHMISFNQVVYVDLKAVLRENSQSS